MKNEFNSNTSEMNAFDERYMFGLHFVSYKNPVSNKRQMALSYQFYEIKKDNSGRMVDAIGNLKFDKKEGNLANPQEIRYYESKIHPHLFVHRSVGERLYIELDSDAGHFKAESYWEKKDDTWKGVIYGYDHNKKHFVEAIITNEIPKNDENKKLLENLIFKKIGRTNKCSINDQLWIPKDILIEFWPKIKDLNSWRKKLHLTIPKKQKRGF